MNRSLQAKHDRAKRQRILQALDNGFARGQAKALVNVCIPEGVKVVKYPTRAWTARSSLSINATRQTCRGDDGCRRGRDHGKRLGACIAYEEFGSELVITRR